MARRRWLLTCAVVLISLLAACDWPMVGGNAGGSRSADGETSISVANVGSLHLAWSAAVNDAIYPQYDPVVAGGVLFAVGRRRSVVDNGAVASLSAFDASGAACGDTPTACPPLWTADLDSSSASAPAVIRGRVWVNTGLALLAFDTRGVAKCTGSPKRCQPVVTAVPPPSRTFAAGIGPIVTATRVFIPETFGSIDSYDAAAADHCSDGTCTTLRTAGGADQFSLVADESAVANGCIFTPRYETINEGPGVVSVITGDGIGIGWPVRAVASPSIAKDSIVVPQVAQLTASPVAPCGTTDPTWASAAGLLRPTTSAAIASGTVFVGSAGGSLFAFDLAGTIGCSGPSTPRSCDALWTAPTGAPMSGAPAVANGVVFVGSDSRRVSAFSAAGTAGCSGTPKTCTPLWSYTTGGPVRTTPAIADGRVYVGAADGTVYAFSTSS